MLFFNARNVAHSSETKHYRYFFRGNKKWMKSVYATWEKCVSYGDKSWRCKNEKCWGKGTGESCACSVFFLCPVGQINQSHTPSLIITRSIRRKCLIPCAPCPPVQMEQRDCTERLKNGESLRRRRRQAGWRKEKLIKRRWQKEGKQIVLIFADKRSLFRDMVRFNWFERNGSVPPYEFHDFGVTFRENSAKFD